MDTCKEIEEFVYEGEFVNPAKYEAVRLYGLEKAKEIWKDREPDFNTIHRLNQIGAMRYLSGEWKNV